MADIFVREVGRQAQDPDCHIHYLSVIFSRNLLTLQYRLVGAVIGQRRMAQPWQADHDHREKASAMGEVVVREVERQVRQ